MKIVEIIRFGKEVLKTMSDYGVKEGDWKYVGLYEEYKEMRRKLLTDIFNKMTDDEKRLYLQHMTNNSNKEMLHAIKGQQSQLEYISKQVGGQSWLRDFASDVGANFLTDGIIWLGSRIIKKL